MLDPTNRVPLEDLDLTPAEQQARQKAMLQELEHLQSDKDRAEDRLLTRLETQEAARRESQRQQEAARSVIRSRPLPRGPIRHPSPRR